jgi:hypothetical protein
MIDEMLKQVVRIITTPDYSFKPALVSGLINKDYTHSC